MKLEFRDVSCGYGKDRILVKNVNMELADGDVCSILGPNGVGKTTFFRTLLNMQKPMKGNIFIDGNDTSKWDPKKMAGYIAYVAQAHVPAYPYRVSEIVMMGRMGQMSAMGQPGLKDYEICEQALEDVGIRHLRDAVYTEISGGERQLLMIARALAQTPKILIMDEPTANLDYGNMVKVMQCVKDLSAKGICVIFSTHMPDQAFMCANRAALFRRNEPALFGDVKDVVTERNLYDAYQTDIQILEVIGAGGQALRVVAPNFR